MLRAGARFLAAGVGLVAGVVGGFSLGGFLYELFGPPWAQFGYEFEGLDWPFWSAVITGFVGLVSGHLIVRGMQRPRVSPLEAAGELVGILGGLFVGGSAGFVLTVLSVGTTDPRWSDARSALVFVLLGAGAALGFAAGSAAARRKDRMSDRPSGGG